MKYFTMREFTASATAVRKGIDNSPSGVVKANLTALVANVLDPLREAFGQPVIVTSGYRCPRLNRAVGGKGKSQHTKGEAADIRTVKDTLPENKKLFDLIRTLNLPFDQLIWEFGSNAGPDWIHVSYCSGRNRREVLRAIRTDSGIIVYERIK